MCSSSDDGFGPRLLESVTYPTDKNELLARAVELGLPSAIREAISRFPMQSFRSRGELIAAVENIGSQPD